MDPKERASRLLDVAEAMCLGDGGFNYAEAIEWVAVLRAAGDGGVRFIQAGTRFYYWVLRDVTDPERGRQIYELLKPYIRLSRQGEAELLKFFKEKIVVSADTKKAVEAW